MSDSLPHATPADPVIDRYLRDVDRTLLRRNLKLSPQERLEQLQELARFADELRRAGRKAAAARSS
jgi:hypothetical protein